MVKHTGIVVGLILGVSVITADAQLPPENMMSRGSSASERSLVVYQDGRAYVSEVRTLTVEKGVHTLYFTDVPRSIMPESVMVEVIGDAEQFVLREQDCAVNSCSRETLLTQAIGSTVSVIPDQSTLPIVEGTLLSASDDPVLLVGNEIRIGVSDGVALKTMPEQMIVQPTLIWKYESTVAGAVTVRVSYLAADMQWNAEYVLSMTGEAAGIFSGWLNVLNNSGQTFANTTLGVMSGDVNTVAPMAEMAYGGVLKSRMAVARDAGVAQSTVQDYHYFNVNEPTTIAQDRRKQIQFVTPRPLSFVKEYRVYGSEGFVQYQQPEKMRVPVGVYVTVVNDEKNRLGLSLPSGTVRMYSTDAEGKRFFLGEDSVQQTAVGEDVVVKMGDASDIVASRVQTDFQQVVFNNVETEWAITVKNVKPTDARVVLVEPLYGSWKIVGNSHPFEKVNATTVKFVLDVPAGEEQTVTYRVKVER